LRLAGWLVEITWPLQWTCQQKQRLRHPIITKTKPLSVQKVRHVKIVEEEFEERGM
jgi:hypothetical protein